MTALATNVAPRNVGRYVLFEEIARGGMASVHIGRLRGPAGFKRTVAIKRLHRDLARDHDFVASFMDEASLAARIQHPNVVSVLDVVAEAGELFLVMEYVHGESLAKLLRAARAKNDLPSCGVAAQIITSVLYGLHAAHEARSDRGIPLQIVHRDVSPQNVIVGSEGVARVLDFGVAKAAHKVQQTTKEGVVKGKVAYMPPEQLNSDGDIDRRVDVYSAGVVFWEALTGERLYDGDIGPIVARILTEDAPLVSSVVKGLPEGVDQVVHKALARKPEDRYRTALELARAIEKVIPPVAISEVSEWVQRVVDESLRYRADVISKTEKVSLPPPPPDSHGSMPDTVLGVLSTPSTEWPSSKGTAKELNQATPPMTATATATATATGETSSARETSEMKTSSEVSSERSGGRVVKRPRSASAVPLIAVLAIVGVLAMILIGGALVLLLRRGRAEPSLATAPTSAASVGFAPMASASATQIQPVVEPTTTTPSATTSVDELDPVPQPHRLPSPSTTPPSPKPAASTRRNCTPPWTLDARGVRVLKRECL